MTTIDLPTVFAMTEHAWRHFDGPGRHDFIDGRNVIDGTVAGQPVRLVRVAPLSDLALEFVGQRVDGVA